MLYDKIKALADKKGLSIYAVEKAVGLGNKTIRNWQTSSPSVANLKLVADYLGTTIDELMKD